MDFKAVSLFANVGIAETYLEEVGVATVVANELIPERGKFYQHLYPDVEMIVGDITDHTIFNLIINKSKEKGVDFLLATPPCQGMSLAGKMDPKDPRNQLIYYAAKAILELCPKYVMLENVPQQLHTTVVVEEETMKIPEYLKRTLGEMYHFAHQSLVSARDYGVPQMRKRNVILLSRKDMPYFWEMPTPQKKEITLREAFQGIPSLDPLLKEGLVETLKLFPDYERKKKEGCKVSPWHQPPVHSEKLVNTMMHTPSGCTAFDNPIHFPKRNDGVRVKGHYNQYRRYNWDKPCRTITQNSAVISSLCCVHPGYPIANGLYSDPRCLSIYELMVVTSLPKDWNIPSWASDKLIRSVIGEGIPPLLVKNLVQELTKQEADH
ncbi:MAG: DNA cytosine methyltransferase [Eubacteriales bacterium]